MTRAEIITMARSCSSLQEFISKVESINVPELAITLDYCFLMDVDVAMDSRLDFIPIDGLVDPSFLVHKKGRSYAITDPEKLTLLNGNLYYDRCLASFFKPGPKKKEMWEINQDALKELLASAPDFQMPELEGKEDAFKLIDSLAEENGLEWNGQGVFTKRVAKIKGSKNLLYVWGDLKSKSFSIDLLAFKCKSHDVDVRYALDHGVDMFNTFYCDRADHPDFVDFINNVILDRIVLKS